MKVLRIFGFIFLVAGIAMYIMGSYIANEVAEGRIKIKNAQETVDGAKTFTDMSPVTKGAGDALASGAQKKIDTGKAEADHYAKLSKGLHGGGIAVFVVGCLMIIASYFIRKKKS